MTNSTNSQSWQDNATETADFLTRLRLAWRVLTGRATMYRLKTRGTVTIAEDCEAVVVECEFRPKTLEVDGG